MSYEFAEGYKIRVQASTHFIVSLVLLTLFETCSFEGAIKLLVATK